MSELNDEAQRLIADARGGDDPVGADRDRVRRALVVRMAAGALAGTAAGGAAQAAGGLTTKALVAATVIGAASGVGILYLRGRDEPPTRPVMAAPRLAPSGSPVWEPLPPPPAEPPSAPPPAARRERPARARVARPLVSPAASLEEETALLATAQRKLRAEAPVEALRALDAYRTRFPDGLLREEATATRVLALAASGDGAGACRAAREFLTRWARSPLAPRVRAVCAAP